MREVPREQPQMAADMADQPAVLRALIDRREELHAELRRRIGAPPRGIALVGRGSSENAAQCGRIMIETATEIPTYLLPPSMVRLYDSRTDLSDFFVIGLSQSGFTPEIGETLQRARHCGAVTLGITSDLASPLAMVADFAFDLGTGAERAVPATKTFTAELAMLAIVAESVGLLPLSTDAWETMASVVEYALADVGPIVLGGSLLRDVDHVFVISAGMGAGIAHEAALKIMEASGVAASAFSSEAFRHGPVSIAGPRHPVIGIAPPGPAHDEVVRVCEGLRGVPTILIGPKTDIPIPSDLPEALGVIPATVRAQQLALEMARRRHVNPDYPPRTQKVVSL